MIIVNFINKQDALVTGLDQYDYGQVLRIQGLNLPTAVEIHFGLEETGGTTTTRIWCNKRWSNGRSNSRLHARKW